MEIKIGKLALLIAILLALSIICLFKPSFALAHGPLDEQIAEMTKQIALAPDNAALYLKRGELHRHHLDWEAAQADYDSAAILDPRLDVVDLARGMMLLDAGRFEQAIVPLNRYLSKHPNNPEALVTRGRVLTKLNENLTAAEDYTLAIKLIQNPTPELFIERARALASFDHMHLDKAIQGLDEGIYILGPIVTLQLFAIELELKRKNYDGALARLDLISAQSARKEKWLMRRGKILQEAGRIDEAILAYRQALQAIASLPPGRQKTKSISRMKTWLEKTLEQISAR
ncbi:MAG: tetratricopeptide repeat protein [bacterium]